MPSREYSGYYCPSMRRNAVFAAISIVGLLVLGYLMFADGSSSPDTRVRAASHRSRVSTSSSAPPTTTPPTTVAPAALVDALPASPTARWIRDENRKPGSRDWVAAPDPTRSIEGFADQVSVERGQTVGLYVSTKAPTFHVEAYRMGWYGGLGGRRVWISAEVPGLVQPPAQQTPVTNMVEAHWTSSLSIVPDQTWPPGVYLLKLVASTGGQHEVPLTIRDDASRAAYVIQQSVTTWQAYNLWGGSNLYQGGSRGARALRSRVVSFDRPYAGDGSADFIGNELGLVTFAEKLGLDVTYWTDIDLHAHPDLLIQHRVLLSLGHDEYWSGPMRAGVEAARDRGVNLVFFGANAVYRRIRLEDSPLGPLRHEVNYKDDRSDPVLASDPKDATVDWRAPPLNQPESSLIGESYECNPVKADMVVYDASSWVFTGTGLNGGSKISGLVGPEYDHYDSGRAHPGNVAIVADSPVTCGSLHSYSNATYYSAPSGAGVFATGTNYWVNALGGPCPSGMCPTGPEVAAITENVLRVFGAGPAGLSHPSAANADAVKVARVRGIPDSVAPPAQVPAPKPPPGRHSSATLVR